MNVNVKPKASKATALRPPPRRSRVSGMDRALQVLDHLRDTGTPAGGYAIAKAIRAPLSTTYLIIDELLERDLLVRHGDGLVWLGPRLHHLGLAYARSLDFLGEASREMHELCRVLGETVQICERDGDHMIVLAMAASPGDLRSAAGTRVPLNWTASGLLLVGHLPDAERLALFKHAARASPGAGAETNPKALAKLAREASAKRLLVQISETDPRLSSVASPICDRTGACVATIAIMPAGRKPAARQRLFCQGGTGCRGEDRTQPRLAARLIRFRTARARCSIAMELRCDHRDVSVPAFGSSRE